jgi:hypothetical protein
MTDHFGLAVERLCAGTDYRETLDLAYEARPKDPRLIAHLNDQLRHNMAVSRLHAELANVQALYDIRSSIDQILQWLTTPDEDDSPTAPVVRLVEDPS